MPGPNPSPSKQTTPVPDSAAVQASLPDDIEALKAMLQSQALMHADIEQRFEAEVQRRLDVEFARQVKAEVGRQITYLYEQFLLSRHRQFGTSSEAHASQARLFDEAEVLATEASGDPAAQDDTGTSTSETQVARGKRSPLPLELPRIDIVHELAEGERMCACGTPLVVIGEEISEQLDIIPMQVRVLRHIRRRYACPGGESAPVTAALPPQPLPKSQASPGLLAMLLTTKFVDGVPLARFEKVLARSGVIKPRHTLARWVIGASQLLQPLHNLMRDLLLDSPVIYMDETPVQVLKEPGRAAASQSYMWVQTGGPPDQPVVIYDYDPSRSRQVPLRLLEGWQGHLMTDGYAGYNAVAKLPGIEHQACMAHARRGFVEAKRVQPKGKHGRADQAIEQIAQLYRIERQAKDMSDRERFLIRQQQSLPVLEKLREWLDLARPVVAPKTALGEALSYLHNHWPRLVRYVERGDLGIDNNRAENAIRPFVLGRKAWLFNDTPAGAHASAVIYSLVETCKANGLEPYTWLRRVLRLLPAANTVDDIAALLPWNLHSHDLASELPA
jgi:transposase